jgi:DNA ligase-1
MSAPISLPPGLDKLVKYEGGKYKFPFMLAPSEPWNPGTDIAGWWVSEKLDGVRALWTGTHFISRGTRDGGQVYNVPEWFKAMMPPVPLDNELWLGRGRFNECSGLCRSNNPNDPRWREMSCVVLDAPMHAGTFEERQEFIRTALDGRAHPNVVLHKQSRLESTAQVEPLLKLVEGLKGEGLIVRKPGSRYEFGRRSPAMRKVITTLREDGRVVGYEQGEGRCAGVVGTLLVQLDDGTVAEVGTGLDDKDRANPPPIGTLVTIAYREKSPKTGKRRFPSYIGIVAP